MGAGQAMMRIPRIKFPQRHPKPSGMIFNLLFLGLNLLHFFPAPEKRRKEQNALVVIAMIRDEN